MIRAGLICTLGAACLLAACASPVPVAPVGPVMMRPGASVALGATAVLHYERVLDHRCPPNVLCIWAGTIRYHFTARGVAGVEAFALEASEPVYRLVRAPALAITLDAAAPGAPADSVTIRVTP